MSCVVNGIDIIYTDNKLYKFNKSGSIRELKGCVDKHNGYRKVQINYNTYLYHRIVYKCCNENWDIDYSNTNNQIDHIDRNKLNNNINNLRIVTASQNNQNKINKGYFWDKSKNKWKASIYVNYKAKHLGYYHTEEEARNAYLEGRKKYNFI
jgi:hypothetical protein